MIKRVEGCSFPRPLWGLYTRLAPRIERSLPLVLPANVCRLVAYVMASNVAHTPGAGDSSTSCSSDSSTLRKIRF